MIRTILLPLDGSPFAERAIPVATHLARRAGAELRLALVHEPVMTLVPAAAVPATGLDDLELRVREQTYLANTALRLGTVGWGAVRYDLVEGSPGPALVELIRRAEADMVVMSTHGRGGFSRFWLGSVADHLVRHVSVPLLLLRPKIDEATPPAEIPLQSALVPLDLSQESEQILATLLEFARLTEAHLTLLHVVQPILDTSTSVPPLPPALLQEILESNRSQAQDHLDQLANQLRSKGIAVATKVVVGYVVAETILEQLDQGKTDFVALSSHGAGGLKRFLLGSVADKVIRGASKPAFVFRPATSAGV